MGSNSLTMRNRIINGNMVIDQRNAGASVSFATGTNGYALDRWYIDNATDGAFTIEQVEDAPAGFYQSLKLTVTTADASIGATQDSVIGQRIEGLNVNDLGFGTASASTVTISFWVKSSLTGTFGGSLMNSAYTRAYPFSFTISSANTWEQKSVTIAGDTSGTWLNTNGVGMRLSISMAAGSSYSGTANAWASSLLLQPTGSTNVIGTSGATFYVTGVQLEAGTTATPFETRPYGMELALCQRYFQLQSAGVSGVCSNTTDFIAAISFTCVMRSQPTASCPALRISDVYTNAWVQSSPSAALRTASVGAVSGGTYVFSNFSGLTAGRFSVVESAGYQPISLSSEL
jgi:hypothetical protein